MSQFAAIAGLAGFGGSAPVSSGASNRSVNVVGNGGTAANLAQLIGISQGAAENGGFSGVFGEDYFGGLVRSPNVSKYIPIAAIGAAIIVAVLLIRKGN